MGLIFFLLIKLFFKYFYCCSFKHYFLVVLFFSLRYERGDGCSADTHVLHLSLTLTFGDNLICRVNRLDNIGFSRKRKD